MEQEEYIVDVGVAEQGLSLFGSEPLYGSGPGRFTVHRDPQSGGCRRRRLGVLLLRRVLYRAVRLLGAGDGSAQEQSPHQRGAEQFHQLLYIIPPVFVCLWTGRRLLYDNQPIAVPLHIPIFVLISEL